MFDVKLCLPFNFMMKWYCYNLLLPSSSMNVACMLHFYANRNFVIYPSPHDPFELFRISFFEDYYSEQSSYG